MITEATLKRAITAARKLEAQGYFERVREGSQKAASLFARLVAWELNPAGDPGDFGCLSKSPGESQVDGFAEDAIVYGNDPEDRENVIDLVNGAGAPGASIGGAIRPRRSHNLWVKPQPLTASQLLFLRPSGEPPPPPPPPTPQYPPYPFPEDTVDGAGVALFADFAQAGQPPNPAMFRFAFRVAYSWLTKEVPDLPASVAKHRKEWRGLLGLPPQ